MNYLLRLYYTLRPLKIRQWWYRITQPAMKSCSRLRGVSPDDLAATLGHLPVLISLPVNRSYEPANDIFCFLNLKVEFPQGIDWNFSAHGLLWTYNLNYFEWLYDDNLSVAERLQTIRSYVTAAGRLRIGRHAYPASLRIIAWTRFLLRFAVKDEPILSRLYQDADWLCRFPEYHLDGNHLWENALAIVHAGVFFRNDHFYKKGSRLLIACLQEQVFKDGGQVEGSPMYHSLLLWRSLQCIEMMRALPMKQNAVLAQFEQAAKKMTGWLSAVTFSDGTWPAINDCTDGIAPTTKELENFARQLRLDIKRQPLQDSRYRMIRAGPMELFIDAADIHPAYQPGHAHADAGTFCLHIHGRPLIVDTGVSTYEAGECRCYQRGTAAHNTICIDDRNSSDVWKSFRVGRRACITGFDETERSLELSQDYLPLIHKVRRAFEWSESMLKITDSFEAERICKAIVNLHFHPDVPLKQLDNFVFIAGSAKIYFEFAAHATVMQYEFAEGFNKLKKGQYICVTLAVNKLMTNIHPL